MTSTEHIEWRRLHRITPVLNAWKVAAGLFAVFVWQSADQLGEIDLAVTTLLLIVAGVIVLGALLGLGFSALAWSRTKYGISEDSIFLHSGVLFRQQRHVRLDRLQTIDVTQPLLARFTGFAALKIESAGGAGSNLSLAYLREDEAQRLRNELLARAAGVTLETDDAGEQHAPAAPEMHLYTLSPGRLVGSLALSGGIVGMLLAAVAVIVLAVVSGNLSSFFAMGAPLLGAAAYFWGRFAGEFSFRVATSPDGIRVRQGLLESKARTVPPGRVQAVRLAQPPLWRTKGWWRITVNIAGYGAEETTGSVLYPVATEAEAAHLLSLVHPDLGDERPLEVLRAGLLGTGTDEGFEHTPARARWLDPLTWRRTGVRMTGTAVLMRTGRWWRSLVLVPHERIQSFGITQGPWERRLDLATFAVHSTPGSIVPQVHHQDAAATHELLEQMTRRARHARHSAGPERWMTAAAAPERAPEVFGGILPSRPAAP
ncbi:PH domain-containing protein [Ruania suaedae]|uniref:PH domain-containing protein n=1 Tax=Ruania suaedae TaxID=2897774 RepID=UPI001E3C9E62|nr:PH domain-containing protein [Ruania suaedae]UFU03510.1 PH domain-containing protein [Ruania suaedae]